MSTDDRPENIAKKMGSAIAALGHFGKSLGQMIEAEEYRRLSKLQEKELAERREVLKEILLDPQKTQTLEENVKKRREFGKKVEEFIADVQTHKLTDKQILERGQDLARERERLDEEKVRLFKRTTSFSPENDPNKGLLAKSFTPAASGVPQLASVPQPSYGVVPHPRQTFSLTL